MKSRVSFLISFEFWNLLLSFLKHVYTQRDSSYFGWLANKKCTSAKMASETKTMKLEHLVNYGVFYIYASKCIFIFRLQYLQTRCRCICTIYMCQYAYALISPNEIYAHCFSFFVQPDICSLLKTIITTFLD